MSLCATSSSLRACSLSTAAAVASGRAGGGGLRSTRPLSGANASGRPTPVARLRARDPPSRVALFRFGDLFRFLELAFRAVPLADGAAERGAGEKAPGRWVFFPEARSPSTALSNLAAAAPVSALVDPRQAPFRPRNATQDERGRGSWCRARPRDRSSWRQASSKV